jgi:diacylglycerol kinase (ATP)
MAKPGGPLRNSIELGQPLQPSQASGPRRLLVIYNPTAGWRRRRRLERTLDRLRRLGCAIELKATSARGDAEAIARAADPRRFDLVVAAGGDGTINEVINGLAGSGLPLALLPLGTANVLAAEIGLAGSVRRIAEAISSGRPRRVHLGQANGRRFAMMAGVGFDAHVVRRVDPRLKRALGQLAYVLTALGEFIAYRPIWYEVEIDGKLHRAATVIVAKGHFYGGRFTVAREARLEEPRLLVALFERGGRWHGVRFAAALLLGRLDRLADFRVLPALRVEVRGPAGEPVQCDGDFTTALPLTVALAEDQLALVFGS